MKRPIVYIPYHQKLDELCDFVFQTARVLLARGYSVTLILYDYAYLFGDPYGREHFSDAYRQLLKHPKFSVIRPVVHITPRKGLRRLYKVSHTLFCERLVSTIARSGGMVWVFWPQDAELVHRIKRRSSNIVCLYDCVDYFTSIDPDLDKVIQKQEAELMRGCDYVFVNSHSLYQMKRTIRSDIHQVPLGFDEHSFKRAEHMSLPHIDRLFAHTPKPIIGYCGYLTFRLDYKLLMKVIVDMPKISFVFLGPTKIFPHEFLEQKTIRLIERLKSLPNVYMIPPITSKAETARAINHFDIGIIPYDRSYPFNRYCFPMKLFEYFYLGKPVVSTPIEELKRLNTYVRIGKTVQEWQRHIHDMLSRHWRDSYIKEQYKLAEDNSWENKIDMILKLL